MEDQKDLIEKAGEVADIGKKNIGWISDNIKVIIIVWLGGWLMFLVGDHKKELAKKDAEIQRLTNRLFQIIDENGIPSTKERLEAKDSTYNAKVNEVNN